MNIRKMILADALRVATVHTLAWQEAYRGIVDQGFLDTLNIQKRTSNWENGIRTNDPPIVRIVAEASSEVIGFACGLENRSPTLIPTSDCELWAIYAHPLQYRRGTGTLLLDSFKQEMKSIGKARLSVCVLSGNMRARGFYESQGGLLSLSNKKVTIGNQALEEVAYEFPP